jgi:hypothetical protein
MSMLNVHVPVHVHAAQHRCVCMCKYVFVCMFMYINAGMLDCPASYQSGTGMKKLTMLGQVRYRTKLRQSGNFSVWYQTEIIDARMPLPGLVSWMPMPSYGEYQYCSLLMNGFVPLSHPPTL